MKESAIVSAILKELRRRGAYAEKLHGNQFQPAVIDIMACYRGRYLGIEVKLPGKEPTPRQWVTLRKIEESGGQAIWATSVDDVTEMLDRLDYIYGHRKEW